MNIWWGQRTVLLGILLTTVLHTVPKTLLTRLVAYADSLPEHPIAASFGQAKIDYNELYRSRMPGFVDRIRAATRIYDPFFTPMRFSRTLQEVTRKRELDGMVGEFVQKMPIEQTELWYIWGPIHGSFHMLVRSLQEMVSLGLMREDLVIKQSHHNIIFCGNTFSFSAYAVDTLFLLALLMKLNPRNIFYLKGTDERHWQQLNLKDELIIRFGNDHAGVPFASEVSRFFNTLPIALYLQAESGQKVRISFSSTDARLDDTSLEDCLEEVRRICKLDQLELTGKKMPIHARIEGGQPSRSLGQENGFEHLKFSQDDDALIWTIFSSSNDYFRTLLDIKKNAVIELRTPRNFNKWRLSLFREEIEKNEIFKKEQEFDVATGQELFMGRNNRYVRSLKVRIRLAKIKQEQLIRACKRQRGGR